MDKAAKNPAAPPPTTAAFNTSMGQFRAQRCVGQHPQDAHHNGNEEDSRSASDECVHGAWTSSRHGPAEAKNGAADEGRLVIGSFVVQFNSIAFDAFGVGLADEPNTEDPHSNCTADDAVHVKILKGEHLLNAEPREYFGFHEDDAEEDANEQSEEISHGPGIKQE